MSFFKIKGTALVNHDDVTGVIFEQPLLYIDVSYKKHVIFFIYSLDPNMNWIFKKYKLSNGREVDNQERNYPMFHKTLLNSKKKDGTFQAFNAEMNKLGPTLLHHPKVRMKSIFYKKK